MTSVPRQVRSGFSLMELMIVITIMSILAMVVVPGYLGWQKRGALSSAKATVQNLKQAIYTYHGDTHRYPERLKDLVRRPSDEKVSRNWVGNYLEQSELPIDPWGNNYRYRQTPGKEHPFELYSYGPSGPGAPKSEWISAWN